MLRLALLFLVISLVSAFFGWGGTGAAAEFAKACFYLFLMIFAATLFLGFTIGNRLRQR